jgi:hypothetical protein
MHFKANINVVSIGIGRFGILYIPPWNYTYGDWIYYMFAIANDDESYWLRIFGFEFSWMRKEI